VEPNLAELAQRALASPQAMPPAHQAALAGLTASDGSLLPALSHKVWALCDGRPLDGALCDGRPLDGALCDGRPLDGALWQDATHRAAKVHVAFAVFPAAPVGVRATAGNASERHEGRQMVQPAGFSVEDRNYAADSLFREPFAVGCRFAAPAQENAVYEVAEERPIAAADVAAGVVRDVTLRRLDTEKHNSLLEQPLRIFEVCGPEPGHVWVLATNALTLSADLIAESSRCRWQIGCSSAG